MEKEKKRIKNKLAISCVYYTICDKERGKIRV